MGDGFCFFNNLRSNRSRANAAGQARFSRQTGVQRAFDHSKPVIDPEKMSQSRPVNGYDIFLLLPWGTGLGQIV